ncbi:MAG: metallopeptidase TldD-related protein [Thermoanaerobaculia bacterium]
MTNLSAVAEALLPSGLEDVELYLKEGRSRRAALGPEGRLVSLHHEQGWAIRASGDQSSLFCCGSGEPKIGPWPRPDGFPVKLPSPRPVADWREPAELRSPLTVEHEALEILEACGKELARELPEARLLRASLEDGESHGQIENTRGVEEGVRQRTATLFLEAALGTEAVTELVGARNARGFAPRALARRLADRLLIRRDGRAAERDRGVLLLAPPVAVRILGALLPVLLGGRDRAVGLAVSDGRIGSPLLTVIDDGRLPEGLFAAPVDGEGMPTGRTVLIEGGELRSALGATADAKTGRGWGCVRRESYRDVPAIGPSHLFIDPNRQQPAGALLADLARGYYLLEAQNAGSFDLESGRFELVVGGFAVRGGRPTGATTRARLRGSMRRLLGGIQGVARDLTFVPLAGHLGSPTLLVEGLEIDGA